MNKKYLEIYQYTLFSLGVFLCLVGIFNGLWLLAGLGAFIAIMSAGTVFHLVSGKYNRFSKLPDDFNRKGE